MKIFLNTRLVTRDRARISVLDRGFLYGDGVFETLRAYDGAIFRLEAHLERLRDSARSVRIALPVPKGEIRSILYRTLAANRIRNGLLRLTVSRGAGPWGPDLPSGTKPTLVVMARPIGGPSPRRFERGVKVVIVPFERLGSRSSVSRIKSTNFLVHLLARSEARRSGAAEALLLNAGGHLTEGTVSNFFMVRRGRLLTPSLDCGLLDGITRRVVLELAGSLGIPARETRLTPRDLSSAEECILTNTSMEIMPVTRIGKLRVGSGRPGEVTKRLARAFRELVKRECERERRRRGRKS
jgi:branched-chain amino acid aminotransferase